MKSQFLKIAGVKTTKAFYDKYPSEAAFFAAHPEAKHLKTMAKGGSAGGKQQQIMQLIQAYAKSTGADPRQLMQHLQQMPPDQQQQAIQQMAQAVQGGDGQQQPQQQMSQPTMQWGGGLNHYDVVTHPYQFQEGGLNTKESIVDYLKDSKENSSFAARKEMAAHYGIKNYKGLPEQNEQLLHSLRKDVEAPDGDMVRPPAPVRSQPSPNPSYPNTLPSHPIVGTPEHVTAPWENGYSLPISQQPVKQPAKQKAVPKQKALPNSPNLPSHPIIGMTAPVIPPMNLTGPVSPFAQPKADSPVPISHVQPVTHPSQQQTVPEEDKRNLESGYIVDRGKNMGYIMKGNKVVKSFPVLTGLNSSGNKHNKSVEWMDDNPKEAVKYRTSPPGTYMMKPNDYYKRTYGEPGFDLSPIPAFGQNPDPEHKDNMGAHFTYHPWERDRFYNMGARDRDVSYGCVNCQKPSIDALNATFPQGDTAIIVDSRIPKDKLFLKNKENIKATGGYIGNDGKRHQATGANWSGNAFYQTGGPHYNFPSAYQYDMSHPDFTPQASDSALYKNVYNQALKNPSLTPAPYETNAINISNTRREFNARNNSSPYIDAARHEYLQQMIQANAIKDARTPRKQDGGDFVPDYGTAYGGGYFQDGGSQDPNAQQASPQQGQSSQGPDPQQVMQEVAQKLQQGEQPEQIIQELVQEGVPQDQAQQIVQQVVQQMQGQQGGGQEQQAPPQAMYGMGMKYGGIHIKKSHEGRFTAYKKRTGKTTEEALHSKDPHVRQMANFARNASHFKHHQDGGQYMQMGGPTVGQTMDVTPAQAAMLRQQGYTFEQI